MKEKLFVMMQYVLPQHFLSRLVGKLAASETLWIKRQFIDFFMDRFDISLEEAERKHADEYRSFNDFFTRALEDGARPICGGEDTLACPADGVISQMGPIDNGRVLQAKGRHYSLSELVALDDDMIAAFKKGQFATIYLSPSDYHRVHAPFKGTLRKAIYVPGDLFSVNDTTAEGVPNLFSRNERLVCLFDTEKGPMGVVLVGAMIVAAIETVWGGLVAPASKSPVTVYQRDPESVELDKGDELGRFLLGSTVILLFPEDAIEFDDRYQAGTATRVGESMGKVRG